MAPCDVLLSVAQTPHRLRRRALVTWTPAQELNEGARAWRGGSSGTTSWGSASAGCSARASSSPPARWRATRPAPPCSPPTSSPACPRCCPPFATPNRRARPRRRRRLQLPQSNLRRVRGVLRGRQHPHGVRAVQRGGGEEFHRLPGVDVRRHGAQRVEGRGGGHRQGLQRARFPRRRAHSPPHRMPLLQGSTKESSTLNMVLTAFHVLFFAFIIVAGFWNGSARNMVTPDGLAPYGVRGVLDGAVVVYFSYIGYDSASTMAEEIRDPARALPVGIAGSVLIVSALYRLMSVALCVMLPYTEIAASAPFSSAFRDKAGWRWASSVVGASASIGIVASLLVAMLGQARYLCVIARARLVPALLAKVHPSTGTPMNATIFLGFCTASIALFTELFGAVSVASSAIFHCTARQGAAGPPSEWTVPLMPWPAAASVFLNVFLMTTLKARSFQRFGIWSLVITVFYVCYGVHSTYTAEENEIGQCNEP